MNATLHPSLQDQLESDHHRSALERDGFCVVDLLDPTQVAEAIATLADVGTAPDDGGLRRCGSLDSDDTAYRTRATDAARAALGVVDAVDVQFVVSWPGDLSGQGLHHPASTAPGAWLHVEVALDRAFGGNGQIWVVPQSHRWFTGPQQHPVTDEAAQLIANGHAVPVGLEPGQALVTSQALLRFTLPNDDRPRRSLTCSIASPVPAAPGPHEQVTAADLAHLEEAGLAAGGRSGPHEPPNGGRLRCAACGTSLHRDAPDPWNGVVPLVRCGRCSVGEVSWGVARTPVTGVAAPLPYPLPPDVEQVLHDEQLDLKLRTDGYVVVPEPVITPEQARALRDAFGDLHDWTGVGHLNDFNQRDRPYRIEAARLMREHLLEALLPVFADHEPFLYTFLCKWPDDASDLEPHQDWMYVDERKGQRTYLAFVALDDVVGDRGRVRVLRGSHRLDSMPRGTDLRAPWLDYDEVMERRLETIDIRVGQCAIWNSALVHSSLPNQSTDPRVGAGLWFARRGTPLTHFRRLDADTVGCFEIDDDFYRTQNPYRLMVSNPPYPVREVVAAAGRDLSPADLDRELDLVQGVEPARQGWFARRRRS